MMSVYKYKLFAARAFKVIGRHKPVPAKVKHCFHTAESCTLFSLNIPTRYLDLAHFEEPLISK